MKPDTVATFLLIACLSGCAYFAKADGMPTDIPQQMLLPDPIVNNGCEPRINPGWPDASGRVQLPMVPKSAFKEVEEPNTLLIILSALSVYFLFLTIDWAVHRNEHK